MSFDQVVVAVLAFIVLAGVLYGNWRIGRPLSEMDERLSRIDQDLERAEGMHRGPNGWRGP